MSASPEPFWSPLRQPIFRLLWIASFASNVGTLMQSVGASWLMTSLSPSMTALVQTAVNLPIFLLALPAGALADVLDRRKLLLVTQLWMLLVATALGLMTVAGHMNAWLLLGFTFVLGLGSALNAPAWQAIIPELVPRDQLAPAVALNSAGFNLARAVGPALGGLVVALAGPGFTFLLNAASFLGVLYVLFRWQRQPEPSVLPAERVWGAMTAGLRYVRYAPSLQAVLLRSGSFVLMASALWALLPLIARYELGLGPSGYGILLGCLGAGAVLGAALMPRLQRLIPRDLTLVLAPAIYGLGMSVPAWTVNFWAVCAGLLGAGVGWLVFLAQCNTAIQVTVPAWVRGRALAVNMLAVFGSLAVGSAAWGAIAERWGLPPALWASSIGLFVFLALTYRFEIPSGEGLDLAPGRHWETPVLVQDVPFEHGPVFVFVEYRIDPAESEAFGRAMAPMRQIRLRDGAIRWNLFKDTADPGRMVESFVVESWIEHLRQHERVTVSDRAIEARAQAFHQGPLPPVVSHFIAESPPTRA
ncbi:MFS transporter [bacterium]|nr:MFS transporter [bacterium]